MHPPRCLEKNPPLRRNGRHSIQKVFQRGLARSTWMASLDRLRKLHLVTKQDNISAACCHGNKISDGNLTCLVYKQIIQGLVHWFCRKQPGSTGNKLTAGII